MPLLQAMLLLLVAEAQPKAPPPPGPIPVVRIGGSDAEGELGVFDPSGRLTLRITGLSEPGALAPGKGGRFLAADRTGMRVIELDEAGSLGTSWSGEREGLLPERIAACPGGGFLVAGEAGVARILPDGSVAWRAPLPAPGHVAGLGRSRDGSALLVLGNRIWQLGPDRVAAEVPFERAALTSLRGEPLPAGGLLLWDHAWPSAFQTDVEDGRLVAQREFEVTRPTTFSVDPSGEPVWVLDSFTLRHARPHGTVSFHVAFEATAAIHLAPADRYVVSYRRKPDLTWPATRPPPSGTPVFRRARPYAWLLGGLIVGVLLHVLRWWRYPRPRTAGQPPTPQPTRTPARRSVRPLVMAAFAAGLTLAILGHARLTQGAASGWLPLYLGGALLAAAAAEAGRRLLCGAEDPFWAALEAARPDLRAWPVLAAGGLLVAAGAFLLYRFSSRQADPADVTGLFLALNLLLLSIALLFASRPRLDLALLVPVGVAAVTLLYRLADAPANDHFDFTWYVWYGWELLTGVVTDPFQTGYVPVPVIGLFPEMAGLALAGPNRVGFRLGSALIGLTAPVAAYLLGAAYRDRRTGLLAGILLAGSLPFLHFTRVPTAGTAATASLWTLALFALAARSNNPGWWIATGSAAGLTLYLWPVARVGPLACAVAGVLLALRSPRAAARRWFGPVLVALALAIWIAPVLPAWVQNPRLAFPRIESSLEVFSFGEGVRTDRLAASFGEPLRRALGGFFALDDNSSQGSLSPGCNSAEAVLLSVGLLIALVEGFSANVLLLTQFGLVLLVLGAFAGTPPWFTRLLPAVPVAAVLMARALTAGFDLLPGLSRVGRRVLLALAAAGTILLSPLPNLRRYLGHETKERPLWTSTAVVQRLTELPGSTRTYVLLETSPDWSLDPASRPVRLGEMLPLVWDLRLTEIHDLAVAFPLASGPKAIVVPTDDSGEGIRRVMGYYPGARVEPITGRTGEALATLVRIEE